MKCRILIDNTWEDLGFSPLPGNNKTVFSAGDVCEFMERAIDGTVLVKSLEDGEWWLLEKEIELLPEGGTK